jgi:hypothetical protein
MERSEYLLEKEELVDPVEIYSHRVTKLESSEALAGLNCTAICMVLMIYEVKYAVCDNKKGITILVQKTDFEMVKDLALQNNYCRRWSSWLKKNGNIDVCKIVT